MGSKPPKRGFRFVPSLMGLAGALACAVSACDEPAVEIYWTSEVAGASVLQRADSVSKKAETVLGGLKGARDVAVDPSALDVYFLEASAAHHQVAKVAAETHDRKDLYGTGNTLYAEGIDLDLVSRTLFFTNHGGEALGAIHFGLMAGSNPETMPPTFPPASGVHHPRGIFVDSQNRKVYWTEQSPGQLRRANLDGSGAELLLEGLTSPFGIAVDPDARFIYWSDNDYMKNAIYRTELKAPKLEAPIVSGLNNPGHLAIAPSVGRLYWTETFGGRIASASLEGGPPREEIGGLDSPVGIAVVPSRSKRSAIPLAGFALLIVGAGCGARTRSAQA